MNSFKDSVHKFTDYLFQAVFDDTGLEKEAVSTPNPSAFGAMASFLVPKISVGLGGSLSNERSNSVDQYKIIKKERHAIRPPVKHNWSLPGSNVDANPPQIFQHELLQNFSIYMFCKVCGAKYILKFFSPEFISHDSFF